MSTTNKFLFLFRFQTGAPAKAQSPEEMQATYAAWNAWKAKFEKELTPGDGLKSEGAVVKAGAVTDGPYIEAKEVIASFAFVTASSLDRAIEIARDCPINKDPGGSIEIRELAGY
jgi:hypothetical protein